ncbi:MAG: formyltransferase family protein [Candidatus Poseidoniia archaeon]|nr:formyltransferase family protein [Candidatus Poseidoniia archaeon]
MNYIFFSITEHPWGREMLSQLIDSGFIPSLIIEENSDGGRTEREKFEFRLGSNPLAPTMHSQIEKYNIPFVEVPIHNDEHCIEHIERVNPDLVVFGGTRIIRGKILEFGEGKGGVLNSHPGLLPECRGSASPAWSVHEGIKIGSSCHFCSSDIDAGDLVGKREIEVRRGDNYHDLCYKTSVVASNLMVEAVVAFSNNKLDDLRMPQGDSPNPVFRYDSEVEKKAIQMLENQKYVHYID